ncbi:MAG: hypothetical protein ACLUHE_17695 [Christensenellales bacterium]
MKTIFDILRGVVIGLANIIPGVSGGTMMVSMGITTRSSAASIRCSRTSNAASKCSGRMRWAWCSAFWVWPS